MKNEDLQKIVFAKCQNDDKLTEIYRDLNDGIGLETIKRGCQITHQFGSIALSTQPDCPRFVRAKGNIQKVKYRLHRKKKRISARTIDGAWYFQQKCSANNEK